jgi:hypothetical protein
MSCGIQLVLGLGASQVLNPLMPLEAKKAECSSAERYDPISLLLAFGRLASTIFMSSLVRKGTCPRPFRRNDDRFGAAPNGRLRRHVDSVFLFDRVTAQTRVRFVKGVN